MILSSRDIRDLTSYPRRAIDEHVARCATCEESTPHVRVLRRRPWLLLLAFAVFATALIAESRGVLLWLPALFLLWLWAMLRSSDRRSVPKCVRCLDRWRRETSTYLIDFF